MKRTQAVCFISTSPERLRECVSAYGKEFGRGRIARSDFVFVVIDTPSTHGDNKKFLSDFSLEKELRVIHAHDNQIPERLPDFAAIFEGKYGGVRNQCLLVSALLGANAVFFDDDTRPANDCLERYERLFVDGKQIVCGKYLKHAGGTQSLLLELVNGLSDGKLCGDAARVKQIFSGIPRQTREILPSAGVNGGNMGIHFEALSRYCFFPTHYRIEDGTYATLAPHFLGRDDAVYNPEERGEARERLPVVFHEKEARAVTELRKSLENELKGSVIASVIHALLEEKNFEPSDENLSEALRANAPLLYKDYLLPYLREKNAENDLLKKIRALREVEVAKEFEKILALELRDVVPTVQELRTETYLFFSSQKNWGQALESAGRMGLESLE